MARRKKTDLRSSQQETTGNLQSQEGIIVEKKENPITTTAVVQRSRKKRTGTSSGLVEQAAVEAAPNAAAKNPQQPPVSAPTEEVQSPKSKRSRRASGTKTSALTSAGKGKPPSKEAEPPAKATLADLFEETKPSKHTARRRKKAEAPSNPSPTPAQTFAQLVDEIVSSRPEETALPAETKPLRKRAPRKTKSQTASAEIGPPAKAEPDPPASALETHAPLSEVKETLKQAKPRKRAAERTPDSKSETEPEKTPKAEPRKRKERPSDSQPPAPDAAGRRTKPEKEPEIPPYVSRHPSARIHFQHGVPYIASGETRMMPFLFFGNPQTSDAEERVFKQMIQAAQAGLNLYSLLLTIRIDPSGATEALGAVRYWVRLVQDINPNACFLWRIMPVPARDWQQRFPEAVPRFADGTVGQPSICAEKWWREAEKAIFNLVRAVEETDEGERTFGYHLDRGEWFYSEASGYDTSTAALDLFREWLRKKYHNDVIALRAAWHDGNAGFNSITIPAFNPHTRPDEDHFYEPRRGGRWIDYHHFLSEATAERILSLARTVKQASGARCLCGTSYGYLFEWGHPYSGHFALGKLIRAEDIHFISAPPTYSDRMPGGTGAPPLPIDSVRLHHKLFLSEEDYATPFGIQPEPDDYNPPMKSSEAVEQVQMRGIGASLTFASGSTWMDLWGNGWLDDTSVWQRATEYERDWEWRTLIGQTEPEVAVLIDETSLGYVKPRSPLIRSLLTQSREALLRCGASIGFYLMEDILRRDFPHAKLIVFLNAWNLSQPIREAIRSKLHGNNRTLLWLYAASLFDDHRSTLETARDVMGIALERQPWASTQGTQLLTKLHPITAAIENNQLGTKERWEPSFYALSDESTALGEYIETGLPSIAIKEHEGWKAVFIGERVLTPEILRGVCSYAGVHIWNHENDLTHVRAPWLHIHGVKAGSRVLTFPERCSLYDLQAGEVLAENTLQHALFVQVGESKRLIAAPAAALETLLQGEKWLPQAFIERTPPQTGEAERERRETKEDLKFEIDEDEEAASELQDSSTGEGKRKKSRRKRKGKQTVSTEKGGDEDSNDGLGLQVEWRR